MRLLLPAALLSVASACSNGGAGGAGSTSTSTHVSGSTSSTGANSTSTGGPGGAGGGTSILRTDDISMTATSELEDEPTVAVGTQGIVAAAWNGNTNNTPVIGYAFSTDGGKTWLPPGIASPADSFGYGDPTLVTAADGTIYLSFVAFDMNFTMGRVHLAKAAPGTTSFAPAVVVNAPTDVGPYDKPVMAITKGQEILVSYSDYSSNQIVVARTSDGASFTQTPAGKPDPAPGLSMPCPSSSGGRTWVVFRGATTIQLRWSDDDGATFPTANASRVSPSTDNNLSEEDPVCVGNGNDVWVAYGLSHDNLDPSKYNWKDYALRLAHSSDGGATFTVVDAHDPTAGALFMEPALALEPKGTLDLAYYVGNMQGDMAGSFRVAQSTDGGQTFKPSSVIASPLMFNDDRTTLFWQGDYSTIVPSGGTLYTTFGHNIPGPDHISFASLPLP